MHHEELPPLTWATILDIIDKNELGKLHRTPSDLNIYKDAMEKVRKNYGSSAKFLIDCQLEWKTTIAENPIPFASTSTYFFMRRELTIGDYTILPNHYPYRMS